MNLNGLRVLAHAINDIDGRQPEREGRVETVNGGLYSIAFDDGTATLRTRSQITVLDLDAYADRIAAAARSESGGGVLPAWGRHQRMGHTVLVGFLEPFGHGTAKITVPAVDGAHDLLPLPEEVHIVPMDGPGFFGFQVLTEEEVRAERADRRPYRPRPTSDRHAAFDESDDLPF